MAKCFHRRLFADPFKPQRCTTGSVKAVNGINKDVSDASRTVANNHLNLPCGLSQFLSITEDTALLPVL